FDLEDVPLNQTAGWSPPASAAVVGSCRPPRRLTRWFALARRRAAGHFLVAKRRWLLAGRLLQGLSDTPLESIHQLQDGHFLTGRCGRRAALQLGLDQGPYLLGSVVTVVGPRDRLSGRVN